MGQIIGIFAYIALLFSMAIFLVVLAVRFVKAHERGASALEEIARKLNTGNGPSK